jgi:hypothetical protein
MNLPIRLPDWETLARLAASVSRGTKKGEAAKAVAYALELYEEAQKALYRAAMDRGGVRSYLHNQSMEDYADFSKSIEGLKDVPKPVSFPATLNDFFRLIVKAKTLDATKRLRDFLSEQGGNTDWAAKFIGKIKEGDKRGGFFTEQKWQPMAGEYMLWWKQQKSAKARDSALGKQSPS